MTLKEKAQWLQKHYHNYSLNWYLSDSVRLEVIFDREYGKYISYVREKVIQDQINDMNRKVEVMKTTYEEYYGTPFEEDLKRSRLETHRKVQAISELLVDDTVVTA